MNFLVEKIIEIGCELGLNRLSEYINGKHKDAEYSVKINEILDCFEKRIKNLDLYEEFDYQRLCEFLNDKVIIQQLTIAITGSVSDRRKARGTIYSKAFACTNAKTSASRNNVKIIINSIIDALRYLKRLEAPAAIRVIMADTVDELTSHMDRCTELVIEEMHKENAKTIDLSKETKKYDSFCHTILENGGRILEDGTLLFNWSYVNLDFLENANDSEVEFMKEQLGARINGSESKEIIIRLFWSEMTMTLNEAKRHDVMPIFQNVVRETGEVSIFLNNGIEMVDRIHVARFFWEEYDMYQLQGDRYTISILVHNNNPIAISMGYNFGDLENVRERLFYLEKVKRIIEANKISIIGNSSIECKLDIETKTLDKSWNIFNETVLFWIYQMKKILTIEEFYNINFRLPLKGTEEDYFSIDVLYASINRQNCRTVPGLPETVIDCDRENTVIIYECEESVGCPDCLKDINIFGYVFKPIEEYIIPCKLFWNKEHHCFETIDGGIPTGVVFEVKM